MSAEFCWYLEHFFTLWPPIDLEKLHIWTKTNSKTTIICILARRWHIRKVPNFMHVHSYLPWVTRPRSMELREAHKLPFAHFGMRERPVSSLLKRIASLTSSTTVVSYCTHKIRFCVWVLQCFDMQFPDGRPSLNSRRRAKCLYIYECAVSVRQPNKRPTCALLSPDENESPPPAPSLFCQLDCSQHILQTARTWDLNKPLISGQFSIL